MKGTVGVLNGLGCAANISSYMSNGEVIHVVLATLCGAVCLITVLRDFFGD